MVEEATKKETVKEKRKSVNLSESKVIVAGGRGVGNAEGFRDLRKLASVMNGEVAGTRVAVEEGWIPVELFGVLFRAAWQIQNGGIGKLFSPGTPRHHVRDDRLQGFARQLARHRATEQMRPLGVRLYVAHNQASHPQFS